MDIVHAVWIASLTGAVVFFSAGLLFRRAFRDAPAPAPAPAQAPAAGPAPLPPAQATLDAARVELASQRAEHQKAVAEADRLRSALDQAMALKGQLDMELAETVVKRDAQLAERAREVERLETELHRTASERLRFETQLSGAQLGTGVLAPARDGRASSTADELAQELTRRDADLSSARAELDWLRALQREANDLRSKVGSVEAARFLTDLVRGPLPARTRRASQASPPAGLRPELEARLQRELEALRAIEPGGTTAALSDASGLLVAASGVGQRQSELEAAAALILDLGDRLRELLPLPALSTLLLADASGIFVRSRWHASGKERYLLTTLGKAPPGTERAEERQVLENLRQLLEGRGDG